MPIILLKHIRDVMLTVSMAVFGFTLLSAQEAAGSDSLINEVKSPDKNQVSEVVVTALGIERDSRKIPYAIQSVETENFSQARELNVINSLQGRVAGMDLIRSSSGLASASRVLLRGNRSIVGNNQPLYIVDGVPFQNGTWSTAVSNYSPWYRPLSAPNSDIGGVQGGDGICNINPDDIESITVLKGANAAALYGSRASNGAIVITTRKGIIKKGIGVEFNTHASLEEAMLVYKFQHVYGQGSNGVYDPHAIWEWGPKMEGQLVDHWSNNPNFIGPAQYAFLPHNNFEAFFQTGLNLSNTLILTGGTDRVRSRFSYTNTHAQGVVENNKLRRHNFNVRCDGNLTDRLSFDAKLTYFNQQIDNRLATGDNHSNPIRAIYHQPDNISLEQAKEFEFFDHAGIRHQHYWVHYSWGNNVYWMLNRTIRAEERNRVLGLASLRYQFTERLSLMIRSSFDQIFENQINKLFNDTHYIANDGNLSLDDRHAVENNNDFLLNYNHLFGDVLSLNMSIGGNMMYRKADSRWMATNRLLKPDFFNINNTSQILANDYLWEKKINSLYAFATIGLKDFFFLDVTARNDWSSTLPKENWSWFYPSTGLSWILTEMMERTPGFLTFAKVRASYAEVGNDTSPYAIHNTYGFGGGGEHGYAWRSGTMAPTNLKPEKTRSIEAGFYIRLFRNRVGVDFTWYRSNTFNQLLRIPLPIASGYSSGYINAGNIQNKGIEIILNLTPLQIGDFRWDIMVNYARNENICIELTEGMTEYTTRGRSWFTTHKAVVGEGYDQIFSSDILRNDDGRVLVSSWSGVPKISFGQTMRMGSSNPDWTGGLSNSFRWKELILSALIDIRMGGVVLSMTEQELATAGYSEGTLEGRDGMVVDGLKDDQDYKANPDGDPIWVENDIEVTAEQYWLWVGGSSLATGGPFFYDASYIRLREVLLGYTWKLKTPLIQSIGLSIYGRNLDFLHNAAGIIDPGMSMGVGNIQGVEGFSIPSTKTYGMNVRFRF
ncbi:MAG: SusC/RagA family TonB-linked outer membrane protein [Bacteroidota bacterium]